MCKHIYALCQRKFSSQKNCREIEDTDLVIDFTKPIEKETHLNSLKRKSESNLEEIKADIRKYYNEIGSNIEKATTVKKLTELKKLLKSASTSYKIFMNANELQEQFEIVETNPPNKKIKKQKFVSKKKQSSKKCKQNLLRAPTTEEAQQIACSLIMKN